MLLYSGYLLSSHFPAIKMSARISATDMSIPGGGMCVECGLTQRFCGAGLCTLVAEDALRSVFSFAGFLVDLHVHGADPQTFSAMNALILIAVDSQQGKIAHGLKEHRDGTQIFAECAVILERKGECNARDIVKRISRKEHPEHNLLQIGGLHQKQPGHQRQR